MRCARRTKIRLVLTWMRVGSQRWGRAEEANRGPSEWSQVSRVLARSLDVFEAGRRRQCWNMANWPIERKQRHQNIWPETEWIIHLRIKEPIQERLSSGVHPSLFVVASMRRAWARWDVGVGMDAAMWWGRTETAKIEATTKELRESEGRDGRGGTGGQGSNQEPLQVSEGAQP